MDDAADVWVPKGSLNAKALRLFRDGMGEINAALADLSRGAVGGLRTSGRRVSVELRKLLFDRTPLVHRVLEGPRFHPLPDKESLVGDVYENAFSLRVAPGTQAGPVPGLVATRTWSVRVCPLHGLRFEKDSKKWTFSWLFDRFGRRMRLGPWLKQRLFSVDGREYTLLDALKFLANKEAVHVDINKDVGAKDMELVHFGHTTYPHIVAVMVASYMLNEFRRSYQTAGQGWESFSGFGDSGVADYEAIGGGEFEGVDIDPMGFGGEFHETGILIPEPGKDWRPVQIEEAPTVQA
ncbi:MAG: hypothetical protein F4Y86_05970 [Gammaproteobacteria bacterium]|nr:hypothetical protein [Gammaproteobacteria bacterium]